MAGDSLTKAPQGDLFKNFRDLIMRNALAAPTSTEPRSVLDNDSFDSAGIGTTRPRLNKKSLKAKLTAHRLSLTAHRLTEIDSAEPPFRVIESINSLVK
jgi:hypothetical protein